MQAHATWVANASIISPFPPSRDSLIGAGVAVHEIRLSFENGYQFDLERMAAALSPRTRLVSIASPQNPSGVQTSRTVVEGLLELLEARCPGHPLHR